MFKKTLLCGALAFTSILPLTVNAAATHSSTAKDALRDTAITAKIKNLYIQAPAIKMLAISASTNNQQVILKGQVATDNQYEQAVMLAHSVDGVGYVDTQDLTVKESKAPLTDTYLTSKVKGQFLKEKLFGKKSIEYWPMKVETKHAGYLSTRERQSRIALSLR